MKKTKIAIGTALPLLLAALLFMSACGTVEKTAAEAEEEFRAAYEEYRMLDDREEKASLMDRFATENPDAESAGRAIGMVVYNRYAQSGDYGGALAYLDEKLGFINNPAVEKAVKLQKLEVLAELKQGETFRSLSEELLDSPLSLTSGERQQVLGAAVNSASWDLAETLSNSLLAEIPEGSDHYARSAVLVKKAWAVHKQGRSEEALEVFEEAGELAPRNFAGYYEYPTMELEFQWASTLLAVGNAEEALEKFAPRALFVKEENRSLQDSYQALLKEVYLESGRDGNAFDAYKAQKKNELSKQVPEFSAPDAGGTTRSFNEIRGEKATLLVFWFPT